MWVRSDTWDRTAAWGDHSAPPVEPGPFEPWMRYRGDLVALPALTGGMTAVALATTGMSVTDLAPAGLQLAP